MARQPVTPGIPVPDVVGKSREEAERILRAESFLVRTTYTGGGPDQVDRVAGQKPAPGTSADRRTWVEITVVGGTGARRAPQGGPPPRLPPTGSTEPTVPGGTAGMKRAPAVGTGQGLQPGPTATGAIPVPPVRLPAQDSAATLSAPDLSGQPIREAIGRALVAGFIPIVEISRGGSGAGGVVIRQTPEAGGSARAGALLRLRVQVASTTDERYVSLPTALGGLLTRERDVFRAAGQDVQVMEVEAPGHPYAGTGRVAAQYPVSSVPRSMARTVTLWIVR